ncbi:DUF1353 domain-containing protein [Streptomyces sp. JCM17656]|nr:DUF1353 domain-containing protein [Streptomyces sp. JCM17656]
MGEAENPVTEQPRRFYDGGVDAAAGRAEVPPDPDADPRIELVRHVLGGQEEFAMQRRIAYRDRHLGELLVPRVTATFRTDLTSVPAFFTWLVPKTGNHLPATLLHDGLIHPPGDPTYVSTEGHVVRRVAADRVLRDAMADAGTALVRRWLVWSAVTTVTMLGGGGTGWTKGRAWYYRLVAALTVVLILALGVLATLDLFDIRIPFNPTQLWMGDRTWFVEIVNGLSAAIAVPLLLARLFWGKDLWIAGAVVGSACRSCCTSRWRCSPSPGCTRRSSVSRGACRVRRQCWRAGDGGGAGVVRGCGDRHAVMDRGLWESRETRVRRMGCPAGKPCTPSDVRGRVSAAPVSPRPPPNSG